MMGAFAGVVGLLSLLFWLSLRFLALPYNVVELFHLWPAPVSAVLLALVFLLVFAPSAGMAVHLQREGRHGLARLLSFLLFHAFLLYLGLRIAVPLESIHDLVGSPVLGWPPELERALRFLALFSWFDLMLVGGALFWLSITQYRWTTLIRRWLPVFLLVWPLGYWVVVEQAATDNLVELLVTGPGGGYGLLLSAWMGLLAMGGSVIGTRLGGLVRSWSVVLLFLALSVGAGFLVINLATEQQVFKYGHHFSALSFLLSVDRQHYLDGLALASRYVLAHLALAFLLGVAQFPVWAGVANSRGGRPEPEKRSWRRWRSQRQMGESAPVRGQSGSAGLPGRFDPWPLLAIAYLAFVIYGSLVPLEFRPRSLAQAWDSFLKIRYLKLGIGSRADWVANILLFIPLAFLWMQALCRSRGYCLAKSVIVWLLALLLSLGIEFTQQFFPPRTVSLNDILAEAMGAGIGILFWWWKGAAVDRWLARVRLLHSRPALADYLLGIYVAGLFLYGVLPLDLTISPVEIYHKWKEGGINLVPFAFRHANGWEWIYAIGTDVLQWMPVSFLLVYSGRAGRLRAWTFVVGLAVLLEGLQLFVYSRVTDVTDILTAMLGGTLGVFFGERLPGKRRVETIARGNRSTCFWWSLGAFTLVGMLLLAVFWYPYDFDLDRSFLRSHVRSLTRVPFYAYYYGTEFRAVTEVLHKVLLFLPLGGAAALAWHCIGAGLGRAWIRGLLIFLIIALPFVIELGQVALPSKVPSSTDLFFEILGGVLGVVIISAFWRLPGAPRPHGTAGNVNIVRDRAGR